MSSPSGPRVVAVHLAGSPPPTGFAKHRVDRVTLRVDHGVVGDRHAGGAPGAPAGPLARPLRQVHLVDVSRYDLLRSGGAHVGPGHLGENVTTSGLDLLGLGLGTVLRLGPGAEVRLTGVRWPRHDEPGSDRVRLHLDHDGVPVGRVGVFAVVVTGGEVRPGDPVEVVTGAEALPPLPPL